MSAHTLSVDEAVLCAAALEYAAKDLNEGAQAGVRLGRGLNTDAVKTADQMLVLRDKLFRAYEPAKAQGGHP